MNLMEELRRIGWYLNESGLKKVTPPPPNSNDVNEIIKLCLDTDFREIAEGALAAKKGPIVLQIQSIRNIAAPKISERSHGPRLLCVELSDGQATIRALELQKVPSLDLNTPPGTKIRFRAEQLQLLGGYILLKQSEVQILGGNVAHLVEKWEVARTMQMYARSGRRPSGAMGPPPWLAFGKNLNEVSENSGLGKEKNFKSLQVATEKEKDNKENEEFNAMRKQVIAEAAKAGTKKIFGGGGQQILDHNIKKILDKGYSEEEARQFLRATNNNLERALFNLKRRQESNKQYVDSGSKSNNITTRTTTSNREGGSSKRGGGANKADEAAATKPAANVSLFDFLTDKLPANAQRPSAVDTKPSNRNSTQAASEIKNNNISNVNSQTSAKESNQRNHQQQNERQTDTRGGRNSEPRQQQSGRTNRNDDNRKNERAERNVGGNSSNANNSSSYNKQNGRINSGGGSGGGGGNRNNYNNNDDNSRRPARNDRSERIGASGGGGGNRKTLNSNNNYQNQNSNETNSNQISRNSEVRQRNHDNQQHNRTNSNRNQQQQRPHQQQQQQQQQHNVTGNTANVNNISHKQVHNNQRRPQSSTKQSTINVNMNYNMNAPPPPTHHQHHSNNYPNTVPTQIQTVANATPTLLPNGFVYDPSKIIGFQSKEANEYAMNLLRSQGKTIAVDPNQTQTLPPPPQQQVTQQQQPGPPPPQPPPIQYLPQPGPVPMAAIAASIQIPVSKPMPPLPHHYAMAGHSMPPQSSDGWSWKVGDLCMAKYWDDGQYYEAEITGISDKTCVVYYINYGNHEEVLKTDCLPITDAHHRPINNYNLQQQMQPSPQQHQRAPMRYYVPPHKRNN